MKAVELYMGCVEYDGQGEVVASVFWKTVRCDGLVSLDIYKHATKTFSGQCFKSDSETPYVRPKEKG